jgi:hypothetical protein|tara:strand:- start:1377 stop:1793 length:417 start_codon:yes stop_codon:yes gene_type:complete
MYLYLVKLDISDEIKNILKIGVAVDVQGRIRHMMKDTGRPVELIHAWKLDGFYGYVRKNYAVEQQAHHYLQGSEFPMADYFPDFGGKTECFDISINKAYSTIGNAIRYAESNPAPLKKGYVITSKGYIKNKSYVRSWE